MERPLTTEGGSREPRAVLVWEEHGLIFLASKIEHGALSQVKWVASEAGKRGGGGQTFSHLEPLKGCSC